VARYTMGRMLRHPGSLGALSWKQLFAARCRIRPTSAAAFAVRVRFRPGTPLQ
jgi:hypothetical protein